MQIADSHIMLEHRDLHQDPRTAATECFRLSDLQSCASQSRGCLEPRWHVLRVLGFMPRRTYPRRDLPEAKLYLRLRNLTHPVDEPMHAAYQWRDQYQGQRAL